MCSTTLVRFIPAFARGSRSRRVCLLALVGEELLHCCAGGFPSNPILFGSVPNRRFTSFEIKFFVTDLAILVFLLAASVDADIGALILVYNL